jgi:hypothetical protein
MKGNLLIIKYCVLAFIINIKRNKIMDKDLKDVKFLPWVGNKYNLGLRIEDESIVFGTKEKPGKKVLVLGKAFILTTKTM